MFRLLVTGRSYIGVSTVSYLYAHVPLSNHSESDQALACGVVPITLYARVSFPHHTNQILLTLPAYPVYLLNGKFLNISQDLRLVYCSNKERTQKAHHRNPPIGQLHAKPAPSPTINFMLNLPPTPIPCDSYAYPPAPR